MSSRGLVGRLGRTAAISLLASGLAGAALLAGEFVAARNRRYAQPQLGLALRTVVGREGAPEVRLVLLGDSTSVGVGVDDVGDTVGGQLARLLADDAGLRVHLSSVGVSGSRSTDLATQVARALLGERPDIAVILIGANDAATLRRPGESAAYLAAAVRRLRDAGVEVVVGTCPDLGAARAIDQPLRELAGWWGKQTGAAQGRAVQAAGGAVVDLAAETGAVFRADAGTLCFDGFHPSADGYRVWAHALLPAVSALAGLGRSAAP